jgi:hypothetical protein|tara:strand:- start:9 stop:320 length:312 start_codon:yes stop_codon:yes gene_type:complete
MNVNQTKAQILKEKDIYDRLHEVCYHFVVITADGSHSTGYFGPPRTLKELVEELAEFHANNNYHTAFVTPISQGILELCAKKPVEITKEKLERIIENIDFLSK